jgi:hypothetical protein
MKIKTQSLNWKDHIYVGHAIDRYYVALNYIPDVIGQYPCLVIRRSDKNNGENEPFIVYGTFLLNNAKKLIRSYDIPLEMYNVLNDHFGTEH